MRHVYYAHNQTQLKRKRYFVLTLIVATTLSGFMVYFNKGTQPNDSTNASAETDLRIDAEVVPGRSYDLSSVTFPSEGFSAIGTLEAGVLNSSQEDEQSAPMASITKVVTALAILDKAPIPEGSQGDTITLSLQDEQYYHDYVAVLGTVAPVTAGLQMTQYEAIQAMLLPSANNIADTLVDRYFDSQEDFITFANEMLSGYGLTKTRLADASGFNPGSVSTPSELIVVGQKALQSRVIAEIVAQPEATIAVAGTVPNYNNLILEPGVTGIKPGLTDEAGLCLLFSAEVQNAVGESVTVIGAAMGITDRMVYRLGTLAMLDASRTAIASQ